MKVYTLPNKLPSNNLEENLQHANITSGSYVIKNFSSLVAGDKFVATVKNISPSGVVLKFADGSELNAKSLVLPEAHIGDNAIFIVKENFKGQILIEMLKSDFNTRNGAIIKEALIAAGLPATIENKQLAAGLMEHGLPIDSKTLQKAAFFKYSVSGITIEKIIFLLEQGFSATGKTSEIFSSYTSLPGSPHFKIGQELNNLINTFFHDIANYNKTQPQNIKNELILKIAEMLFANGNIFEELPGTSKNSFNNLTGMLGQSTAENKTGTSNFTGIESNAANINATGIRSDVAQNAIKKALKGEAADFDKGFVLPEGDDISPFINEIKKAFFINIEDIKGGVQINKLYEKIIKAISEIKELYLSLNPEGDFGIEETAKGFGEFAEELAGKLEKLENIRDNILFMNNIKNTKEYFQIPFILNGKENTCEIHIFNNKKKNTSKSETTNVLIALDYLNLGHIEIFINKNQKQLSFLFRADNDKLLKLIAQNAHKLSQPLNIMGFNILQTNYKMLSEKFDISMVPEELKPQKDKARRYSFDMRV